MLFAASLMWSLVGVLVKAASSMVDSSIITLSRFLFGVLFLGAFLLIKDKKIKVVLKSPWIWIGALGKCCNYIFENLGISIGFAYGNIIVMPLQSLILLVISTLFFKEKLTAKHWFAAGLCFIGVFFVSWNGLPLSVLLDTNMLVFVLFAFSSIGASFHFLSQKVLIKNTDSGTMNFSMFLISTLITALPVPFTGSVKGEFSTVALLALIGLGFITGISFYLYANSLKKVPFIVAVIVGNSSSLFTLIWARLFFNEPITPYIIFGSILFVVGIIFINIPAGKIVRKKQPCQADADF